MLPCLENNPADAVFALACNAGCGPHAVTLYHTGYDLTNIFFTIMTMNKYGTPCFGKPLPASLTFEYPVS